MIDIASAYVEIQDRLVDAVTSGVDVNVSAPACPGWTARDVLAHHVGLVSDIAHDRLDVLAVVAARLGDQWRDPDVARARDQMTADQVAARRDKNVAALVAEWRAATDALLPMLRGEAPVPEALPATIPFVLTIDLVVHETDVRSAVGLARAAPSAALSLAVAGYASGLEQRIRELRLPTLALAYDDRQRLLGDGAASVTLRSDKHELVRVLAGRRTNEQIAALDWDGDPSPFLPVLSAYGPTTVPGHD